MTIPGVACFQLNITFDLAILMFIRGVIMLFKVQRFLSREYKNKDA